jgi:hypothetical protein
VSQRPPNGAHSPRYCRLAAPTRVPPARTPAVGPHRGNVCGNRPRAMGDSGAGLRAHPGAFTRPVSPTARCMGSKQALVGITPPVVRGAHSCCHLLYLPAHSLAGR